MYMYSPRFSLPHQCCYYNIIHNQPFFWHTVPMSLEKASYSYVLSILSYTVHNGTVYSGLMYAGRPPEKFICQHDTVQSLLAKVVKFCYSFVA